MTRGAVRLILMAFLATTLSALDPVPARAQQPELERLGDLIVGTWTAEDSRHVIEWGVGHRLIKSQSFFLVDGEWSLVSEGFWFWDGEADLIRGTHLAIGMPADRFEYETVVKSDEVVHDLTAFGATREHYVETWTFDGEGYDWRLEQPTPDGPQRIMGGRYQKAERQ